LQKEFKLGTTIISVEGYEMIGESETIDLTDIDLQEIKKYNSNSLESKNLMFLRESIKEINYCAGAHSCNPEGEKIQYSSTVYINKHMSYLGLNFLTNKYIERYKRATNMRKFGMAIHYTNDTSEIECRYRHKLHTCKLID
jgi:hypothetical protein